MLRRLSLIAFSSLLLVLLTDVAGANAAVANAPVPALRVVPDTRAELRDLPLASAGPSPAPAAPPAPSPPPAPPATVWPVDPAAPVTDGFGSREAPAAGASTFHNGIDLGAAEGAPVLAAAAGTVTHVVATDSGGCGVEVVVQHAEPLGSAATRYCHLLEGSPVVTVGTAVSAGQQLAAVGSTGVSTGPHLHFEVLLPGGPPVEPVGWLHGNGAIPA